MAKQSWNIDTSHSGLYFVARHMIIARVRGRFGVWSGSIAVDDADPAHPQVEARIQAASVNTADEKRDTHLRSSDFFNAEKFPELVFKGKRVVGQGDRFQLVGDLTIRDVTREVTLEVEHTGTGKDPWGNQREGYSARTSVNRTDYGLVWNVALEAGGVLVSERIDIEIDLSAVKVP